MIAMKISNINAKLIKVIPGLYEKVISAIYSECKVGKWFVITCVWGCLLSPTLFNILLDLIMNEDILDHEGTISIKGRPLHI